MIFYFSATGNSKWVAEQLADLTNDSIHDIAATNNGKPLPEEVQTADVIGIVFPIHSWAPPQPVMNFLTSLKTKSSAYRYAVFTCGDDCGKTADIIDKRFPLSAVWSVQMPNTYVPMFSLDSDGLCREKISKAKVVLPQIAETIAERRHKQDVNEGGAAWLKTYAVKPLFDKFCISAKGFIANDDCIGCGICVKACPMQNISLKEGKPSWDNQCIHCMACYHVCPKNAIHYKKTTLTKGQYNIKKLLQTSQL